MTLAVLCPVQVIGSEEVVMTGTPGFNRGFFCTAATASVAARPLAFSNFLFSQRSTQP
jgi:hypothetical protein